MCQTSCMHWLLGLKCQYVLMSNDGDFMVNFEPGQYIYKKFKHISPRCSVCKPNLHHSPIRGKTIILQMTQYVSIHSPKLRRWPMIRLYFYNLQGLAVGHYSRNLFSLLCIDILRRKLKLVTEISFLPKRPRT